MHDTFETDGSGCLAHPPAAPSAEPKGLLRMKEVRALTGWQAHYVDKLVESGALTVWRPPWSRKAWRFFYRAEVEAILQPKAKG